jgi:hypothetical protein
MRGSAVALLALLVVSGSAAQEQRLSDVAADIVLRPPSEQAVFVDLTPPVGATSSSQGLVELAEEYKQNLAVVVGLLAEAGEDDRFFAADWRDRMLGACIELDGVGYSLAAVRPPERYSGTHGELVDASQQCARGTDTIREAMRLDQQSYGQAMRDLGECNTAVSRSVAEVHRIRRAELQESRAEFEDPLATASGVAELCSSRSGGDGAAFEGCMAAQERARQAIAGRFNFTVLLDEPIFNVIRNSCRLDWPHDFVGRDRCERQRIAEAK